MPGSCKTLAKPSASPAMVCVSSKGAGAPRWRAVPPWHSGTSRVSTPCSSLLHLWLCSITRCDHTFAGTARLLDSLSFPGNEGSIPLLAVHKPAPAGALEGLSSAWTHTEPGLLGAGFLPPDCEHTHTEPFQRLMFDSSREKAQMLK